MSGSTTIGCWRIILNPVPEGTHRRRVTTSHAGSGSPFSYRQTSGGRGQAHPRTPEEDFGHIVGDGLVVIRYATALAAHQVDALKTYVTGTNHVTSGPAAAAEPAVRAIAQKRTLTCAEFDLIAVQDFTGRWIADYTS